MIIEVAINGATPQSRNPNVPRSPEEIIPDVLACLDAGASVVHTHIDDMRLNGEEAADRYLASYRPIIAARPDAILYGTIGGGTTIEERCQHTQMLADSGTMRMAFADPGSTSFAVPNEVGLPKRMRSLTGNEEQMGWLYINPYEEIEYTFDLLSRYKLGPGISIYEPNFLRSTVVWHRAGRLPRGAFVKLYMVGDYNSIDGSKSYPFWGLPATALSVEAYLQILEETNLPWAVATFGGDVTETGLSEFAIKRGGHVRVGLEDYAGSRSPANAELVAEVVELARVTGRSVATCDQAAAILDLPRRTA